MTALVPIKTRYRFFARLALGALPLACAAVPPPFRLNPGEEPERYRIQCRASRACRTRATAVCGGDYVALATSSNGTEQREVESTGVSSTGPTHGVAWKGELEVRCGRQLPALRLARSKKRHPARAAATTSRPAATPGAAATRKSVVVATPPKPTPAAGAGSAVAHEPARTQAPPVCVPGATQACLGAGACSGAQACQPDGAGFKACDCGPAPATAPESLAPEPAAP